MIAQSLKHLKREGGALHHILTRLGMRAGRLPRKPRRAVDQWAFGTLCDQRGPVRHSPSSCPGMVFEVRKARGELRKNGKWVYTEH